jgi:hypothetical protein
MHTELQIHVFRQNVPIGLDHLAIDGAEVAQRVITASIARIYVSKTQNEEKLVGIVAKNTEKFGRQVLRRQKLALLSQVRNVEICCAVVNYAPNSLSWVRSGFLDSLVIESGVKRNRSNQFAALYGLSIKYILILFTLSR